MSEALRVLEHVARQEGLVSLLSVPLLFSGQAIGTLQQAGYAPVLDQPLWNSRWLLSEASIGGRLLHTLIGYTDQPDGLQLIAYAVTLGLIFVLSRAPRTPSQRSRIRWSHVVSKRFTRAAPETAAALEEWASRTRDPRPIPP